MPAKAEGPLMVAEGVTPAGTGTLIAAAAIPVREDQEVQGPPGAGLIPIGTITVPPAVDGPAAAPVVAVPAREDPARVVVQAEAVDLPPWTGMK
jgi:hypothetical protein